MTDHHPPAAAASVDPCVEVVDLCRDLLRIDSSNYGDNSGPGEREAAEYVMASLQEVGLDPVLLESAERRANVVVRIPGADRDRPGLCVHGHLDVVPADASAWQVDPFGGEIRDDCLWGRGAVDMKDMDAMILAVVRDMMRRGEQPPRDLVVAFFADEEAGSVYGSEWMMEHHPGLFAGVTEAISEVGGFSVTLPDRHTGLPRRAYLIQTAEKGIAWMNLTAKGRAGHGSMPNDDNPVVHLAEALSRISKHTFPREYLASVRGLFDGLRDLSGIDYTDDDCEALLAAIPGARGFVQATLADTANPTMMQAGWKHNVVPGEATAGVDCRFLPGRYDKLTATLQELAGDKVEVTPHHVGRDLETPFDGPLVEAMKAAVLAEDPEAVILPYCLSGGTDNKQLAQLGITGYGFAPLKLPADVRFAEMFHGVDERVPLDALRFGTATLGRFLRNC